MSGRKGSGEIPDNRTRLDHQLSGVARTGFYFPRIRAVLSPLNDELKRLDFLLGKWKGQSENQFGEEGIIESTFQCSNDPSDMFIMILGESKSHGKIANKSSSYIMYDANVSKFVRKSIFSYGWINNESGVMSGNRLTFDVIGIDGEPKYFKGMKWRSFIHKYSDKEIGLGLEVSENNVPFRLYGETKAKRVH